MDDLLDPNVKSQNGNYGGGGKLPNATAILVLGIISIVGCILYGIPGLICGIIALSLYKKDQKLYLSDKAHYEESHKNAKAGYICAIIGTSISALYFVIVLLIILIALGSTRF